MARDYITLLKNRKFIFLWSSQILSQITINIMNFLLLLNLFRNTGSTIATSFLWIAYALPAIIVGPIGAAASDMFDRKKILALTNILQAIVILLFAISHRSSMYLLYGVAVFYSFLNQFYVPAEISSLPQIVKKELFAYANGVFFLTQQAAVIIGFGLAGPIQKLLGYDISLLACSGMLILAFVSVLKLPKLKTTDKMPYGFENAFTHFFTRIYEGYIYIKEHRNVLYPFILLAGLQIALTVIVVNTPAIAVDIFNISTESIGTLIVVPGGLGAIVGTLLIPKILKKGIRKIKIIKISFVFLTLSLFLLTFLIPMIGYIHLLIIGFLILGTIGFSYVGILIPSQTFLQEQTPGGLRGRVFGNYWFIVTILTVFPVLISGTLSEIFGIKILMFILTGSVFAFSILINRKKELFASKVI